MSTELRLHQDLYGAGAIAEAAGLYASHAKIERKNDGPYVVLAIASERAGRAERVAKELANYALGLTIQARKPAADPAEPGAAQHRASPDLAGAR